MLTACLLAIPIWCLTESPFWSVALVTAIDGIAFLPTVCKSWTRADLEKAQTYALNGAKFALMLIALDRYSVTTVLYPTFQVAMFGLFVVMLVWRRDWQTVKK